MLLVTSCASIVNEDTTKVKLMTSTGEKADVTIDGIKYSIPATIKVKRSREKLDIVSNNENCDKNTTVESTIDPVFFGNIIIGGGLGSTTDFAQAICGLTKKKRLSFVKNN